MKQDSHKAITEALSAANSAKDKRERAEIAARHADTDHSNALDAEERANRELGKAIALAVWNRSERKAFRDVLQGMLSPVEGMTCRTSMDERRAEMKKVAVPICEESNSRGVIMDDMESALAEQLEEAGK